MTDPTEGPMSPELAATEGFAAATAWGNYYGGSGTAVSEVDLGGTTVKKYTNLDYAIAEGFSVDAGTAGLNTLHVDVWRLDDTADFGIKLVDYGSDGNWSGGDDVEGEIRFTASDVPAGEWVRLEIPLSEFNLATSGSISQLIFSSRDVDGNASLDTVYVANAFLSADLAPTGPEEGEGGEGHHDVIEFDVGVITDTSDGKNKYTFFDIGNDSYVGMDGLSETPVASPTLEFVPRNTYIFYQTTADATSHPFILSSSEVWDTSDQMSLAQLRGFQLIRSLMRV